MPAITATSIKGVGAITITETTLDGSDSLVFDRGKSPILTLRNPTGGAISPVIDGDGGSTVDLEGLGTIDVSAGFAVGSIAAGDVVSIRLNSILEYLKGTIAINSGSTLIATLLEQ